MKKLLAVLLALFLLTACGTGNNPPAETTGGDTTVGDTTTDGGTTEGEAQIAADTLFAQWLDDNGFTAGYRVEGLLSEYHYRKISMSTPFRVVSKNGWNSNEGYIKTEDAFLKDRFFADHKDFLDAYGTRNTEFSFFSEIPLDELSLPGNIQFGDSLSVVLGVFGLPEEGIHDLPVKVLRETDTQNVTFFDMSRSEVQDSRGYHRKLVYTQTIAEKNEALEKNVVRSVTIWFNSREEGLPVAKLEVSVRGTEKYFQRSASEGLTFSPIWNDSAYAVTGIGTCTDTELVIPSVYMEKPVTVIAPHAFQYCQSITSVELPHTMEEIQYAAFAFCKNLNSVQMRNGLWYLGERAFDDCIRLKTVKLSDSVAEISKDAFSGCKGLEEIVIPKSVKEIKQHTFVDCESLKTVRLENSGCEFEYEAFRGCESLSEIYYNGTARQWELRSHDPSWDLLCGAYRVICTDQTIEPSAE